MAALECFDKAITLAHVKIKEQLEGSIPHDEPFVDHLGKLRCLVS